MGIFSNKRNIKKDRSDFSFVLRLIEQSGNNPFSLTSDRKEITRRNKQEINGSLFDINEINDEIKKPSFSADEIEQYKKIFLDLKINVNIKTLISYQYIKYIIEPLTIEDFTKTIKNKKILLFYLKIKELTIDNEKGVFIFEKDLHKNGILPLYKTIEISKNEDIVINFGTDENNNILSVNIEKLPHLLVSGTTGSGKSVFLNSLILSLVYNYDTSDLRLCLVDPKRTEFSLFNELPHLLYDNIFSFDYTILLLDEIIKEMYQRYNILKNNNCKNIKEYNEKYLNDKMYKIIVIIDEVADLMAQDKKAIETRLCRIAQLSRACGIYLIIATQRPSTDVITGLIKANFPSRLCFKVASIYDSKTILDKKGAEQLKGNGDALFQSVEMTEPLRVQTPFIKTQTIERILKK